MSKKNEIKLNNEENISGAGQEVLELMKELNLHLSRRIPLYQKKYLRPREAANFIGVSLPTLHHLTENGMFDKYPIGKNRYYYIKQELIDAMEQGKKDNR